MARKKLVETEELELNDQPKEEVKKELSFEEQLADIIARGGKNTFSKLAELRAKVEQKLSGDASLAELFWKINDEMKRA